MSRSAHVLATSKGSEQVTSLATCEELLLFEYSPRRACAGTTAVNTSRPDKWDLDGVMVQHQKFTITTRM